MRKFLGGLFGIIVIAILLSYLMRNTIIEYFGEKIGSQEYGAKIDIDGVDFNLFDGILKVERVQITDKKNTMKNIGDIKDITLDIQYKPILKNLIVVDEATFGLVETQTLREKDGKIEGVDLEEVEENKDKSILPPTVTTLNFEELIESVKGKDYKERLDSLNLQIVKEYEVERENIEKIYKYWNDGVKEKGYKGKLEDIEKQYKVLEEKIKNEKNPIKLVNELEELNKLIKDIDVLVKTVEEEKKQFEKDLNTVKNTRDTAFKYVQSENIFKDITGWEDKALQNEINGILTDSFKEYIKENIALLNSLKEKKNTPVTEPAYHFWIKDATVTFRYLNYDLNGKMRNLTSIAGITELPMVINLVGDDKTIIGTLIGEIYQNKEKGKVDFNLSGITIDKSIIKENKELAPLNGSKIDFNYSMTLKGEIFDILGDIALYSLNINTEILDVDPKVKEILGDSLQGVNRLILNYNYDGDSKQIAVNSNIGVILSEIFKEILNGNINRYKEEARLIAITEVEKYKGQLDLEIDRFKDIKGVLDGNSEQLKILKELGLKTVLEKTNLSGDGTFEKNIGDSLKNLFN